MNEDQRKKIQEAIKSHRAAIATLEDEKLMEQLFESAAAVKRGERGTRLSEIKRKSPRARRIPS
jgi:hypothetical protein